MPHTQQEEDLIFDFDHAENKPHTRFESKYLKDKTSICPTDFLIQLEDVYQFIEVKDPDRPNPDNVQKFIEDMQSNKIAEDMSKTFRDSYFFAANQGKNDRSVDFIVLICWSQMDTAMMTAVSDRIRRLIPWINGGYGVTPFRKCVVMNFATWRREFGDHSIWRVSEIEG
jgi:hypothetical protein